MRQFTVLAALLLALSGCNAAQLPSGSPASALPQTAASGMPPGNGPYGDPGAMPPGGPGPMITMALDTDGDGAISQAELQALPGPDGQTMDATMAQDLFSRLDRNQDGVLTADELTPPAPPSDQPPQQPPAA